MAAAVLRLQRTAGNAAAQQLAGRLQPPPRPRAPAVARRTREAPAGAAALAGAVARRRGVPRTVSVKDPKTNIPNPTGKGVVQTNAATIETYLRDLCADGSVTVDGADGRGLDTGLVLQHRSDATRLRRPARTVGGDLHDAGRLRLRVRHDRLEAPLDDRGRRRLLAAHRLRRRTTPPTA